MAKWLYAYVIPLLLIAAPISGCLANQDSTEDQIEDKIFLTATYHSAWQKPQVNLTPEFIEDIWVISGMTVFHNGSIYIYWPSWGDESSPTNQAECTEEFEDSSHMEGYWFEEICFMGYQEPTMRTYDITDSTISYSFWCLEEEDNLDECAYSERTHFYDFMHRDYPINAAFQGQVFPIQSLIQLSYVDLVTPNNPDRCVSTETNECFGPDNPSGTCNILLEVEANPELIFSAASVVLPIPHGASLPDGPWENSTAFVAEAAALVPQCDEFYL